MTLYVDVYSDVICPWCFIGKHRLEKALMAVKDRYKFCVEWLPFELNPDMPEAGLDRKTYRSAKFGSWERSLSLDDQVKTVGATEGLRFRHDLMKRTPNTTNAHKLILLSGREGVQGKVVDAIFNAYFVEGKDVGSLGTLIEIAVTVGMAATSARTFLESNEGTDALNEAIAKGRALRINSVPTFVINHHVSVSGAQSVESFIRAFEHAARPDLSDEMPQGKRYGA